MWWIFVQIVCFIANELKLERDKNTELRNKRSIQIIEFNIRRENSIISWKRFVPRFRRVDIDQLCGIVHFCNRIFAWWNPQYESRKCSWMSDIENGSMKSEHVPFFLLEISCDVTLLKRSISNVRNDLCVNPYCIGFSDGNFLFHRT